MAALTAAAVLAGGGPAAASADGCPNARVRAQQGSEFLPNCMAYEMLSPAQKFSQNAIVSALGSDGGRAFVGSGGGFAGTPSTAGLGNLYGAARADSGWSAHPLNLSAKDFANVGYGLDATPDLSRGLTVSPTQEQARNGQERFYFRAFDGSLAPASPVLTNRVTTANPYFVEYVGGADDLSSYVFTTNGVNVLPGPDPASPNVTNLYEVTDALAGNPVVRRADVDSSSSVIGAACPRMLGGAGRKFNAVADDGTKIFFSAYPDCSGIRGPLRVFARVNGATTVEVSESNCARVEDLAHVPPITACGASADVQYEGASADGSSVFLTTAQQLVDEDTDESSDLYEYRFGIGGGSPTLERISAPSAGAADSDAAVQGVVRVADKGDRAYFVAGNRLTVAPNEAGESPQAGQPNLYLFERTAAHPAGHLVFVTTFTAADSALWGPDITRGARLAGASRFLVLNSSTPLTEDDTDSAADVFRYDAETGAMVRLSRSTDGDGNSGNAEVAATIEPPDYSFASRVGEGLSQVSADGTTVVFRTSEALDVHDVNGLDDIYEWRDGKVALVTDGRGPEAGHRTDLASYGVSADGSTVAFTTGQRLVAEDVDGATDAYIARVGGGFLSTAPTDDSCDGDACQGTPTESPLLPGPLSDGFTGPGNPEGPLTPAIVPAKPVISKVKTVRGTSTHIRVTVPAKGTLRISGSGIAGSSKAVAKGGTYRVLLRLSKRAQGTLRRKGQVKVRATFGFVSLSGASSTAGVSVTFKTKKAKKEARKASARLVRRASVLSSGARKGR